MSKTKPNSLPYSEAPDGVFMDARAVARCYGVTVETVRKWAREGKITSYQTPGGRYRFRAPDPVGPIGVGGIAAADGAKRGKP